jgi:hypothetical protein
LTQLLSCHPQYNGHAILTFAWGAFVVVLPREDADATCEVLLGQETADVDVTPADRRDLTHTVTAMERGKPVVAPAPAQ